MIRVNVYTPSNVFICNDYREIVHYLTMLEATNIIKTVLRCKCGVMQGIFATEQDGSYIVIGNCKHCGYDMELIDDFDPLKNYEYGSTTYVRV